jgi:trans-aconitate methyltransferase
MTHPQPQTPHAAGTGHRPVYFDEVAELFAVFAADTDGIYRPWLTDTLTSLPRRPADRAVDLGCGSGRWTGLLLDRYSEVLAVDIADREIRMARTTYPAARFHTRDLLEVTPDTDGLFDLVLSVNTVHHLRDHDRVLPHLRSLVAPGGTVIVVDITDPGGWATLDYQITDAFRDAEESYRQRSRDHRIAGKVLELHLHPAWLEHALTDVPLTRAEFLRRYAAVFPGAQFTDLHRVVTAMRWRDPGLPARARVGVLV